MAKKRLSHKTVKKKFKALEKTLMAYEKGQSSGVKQKAKKRAERIFYKLVLYYEKRKVAISARLVISESVQFEFRHSPYRYYLWEPNYFV